MFGGGHTPREVDPIQPIRASAIRGHLRFWWRATAGAKYSTAKSLYDEEAKLWGSSANSNKDGTIAGGPGKVSVRVDEVKHGDPKSYTQLTSERSDKPLAYLLFPFNSDKGQPEAVARKELSFKLILSCPDSNQDEVKTALKAWIAFGGIGARSRRGCGALQVTDKPDEYLMKAPYQDWMQSLLTVKTSETSDFSVLNNARVSIGELTDCEKVWRKLAEFWIKFRKGNINADSLQTAQRSGCKWPDYREVLTPFERNPTQTVALAKPYFGLPINYNKFPESHPPANYSPIVKSELTERMASPVILKPIACADGKIRPLLVTLSAPRPKRVRIEDKSVALDTFQNCKVLGELNAKDPVEAIGHAAEECFGKNSFSLGGKS